MLRQIIPPSTVRSAARHVRHLVRRPVAATCRVSRTGRFHSSCEYENALPNASKRRDSSSGSQGTGRHFMGALTMTGVGLVTYMLATRQPVHLESQIAHPDKASSQLIPYDEVQRHVAEDSCWVIINGWVYDVTGFLQQHPGGVHAILSMAGSDASEVFNSLHPSDALELLPLEARVGAIDPSTLPVLDEEEDMTEEQRKRATARSQMPRADDMLLVQDFEDWAQKVLSNTAWSYYRSAADEERTFAENRDAFYRYFLRPRILHDVTEGSLETTILGIPSSMPLFISPAAMAKLGHPLGEVNITRAAAECGVVQAISSNASCSLNEMFGAAEPGQPLIFQLYLNKDRAASAELIRKVDQLGARAIMFTVDVCWASKRTLDVRAKTATNLPTPGPSSNSSSEPPKAKASSVADAIGGYQDRNLTWKDIEFIRSHTKLPLIIKGVQSVEDVIKCVEHGAEGVILSNHGGRQADYAPAPIDILYEIRCLRPDLFDKIEIMVDGGIRSGADVVKALALGAKSVGIGRPVLYANGTHGEEGIKRVLEIFREEITNTMRNCGVTRVEDLKPEMVGPRGPWVGMNRPPYVSHPTS